MMLVTRVRSTLPELEYVGEDCGQLQLAEGVTTYAVPFPCALIDLGECEWQCDKQGFIRGHARVVVRLAFNCREDVTADEANAEALRIRLSTCERLWAALNRCTLATTCSPLQMTQSRTYAIPGSKKVYETTFAMSLILPLEAA